MQSSKTQNQPVSNYRPDIDGMRALAVVAVVAFHAFPKAVPGGFTGVDVFLVISGFLISRIILDEIESNTFTLLRFYERRIKRIFPALSCVLFACLLIGWIVLFPDEYRQLAKHVLAAAGFASNIVFWREAGYFDVIGARKPLLHLWSLGVEEQFYMFWPCLLLFIHRKRWATTALTALLLISFGANVLFAPAHPSAVFYLPFTRIWEFLLGYAALKFIRLGYLEHAAKARSSCSFAGIMLVAGSAFLIGEPAVYPGWLALFPALGTTLLILGGEQAWINRRILSSRPFVLVGLMSYTLYLWHWPLLSFATILAQPTVELRMSLVALSFLLAWLTWRYVEVGIRHSHNPRTASRLVWVLASVAFLGGFVFMTRGVDFRPRYKTSWAALQDMTPAFRGVECGIPHRDLNLCRQSKPGPIDAVVIGDSHAASIFTGLASDDLARNWLLLGNTGCPPLLGIVTKPEAGLGRPDCSQKMPQIEKYLLGPSAPPIVVFAFYGYYGRNNAVADDQPEGGYNPRNISFDSAPLRSNQVAFGMGLSNMIEVALGRHKSVYLMVDVPELPFFPKDCIRDAVFGFTGHKSECVISRTAIDSAQAGLRSMVSGLADKWPALEIFDPLPVVCGSGDCTPVRNDLSYYVDRQHMSLRGSQAVSRSLLGLIDQSSRLHFASQMLHRQ